MPITVFFAHIAAIPFKGCLNITVINSVLAQMGVCFGSYSGRD